MRFGFFSLLWFGCVALVFVVLVPISALAAGAACQSKLLEDSRSLDYATRYRKRSHGERCEGFYISEVSNELEAVGLLQHPLRFDPDDGALTLASAVPDRSIAIVGQLIPSRRYWRLDAQIDANASLRWPTGLLTGQRFRAESVGLFGKLTDHAGGWMVPIDVRDGPSSPERPRLLLRAPEALARVQWRFVSAPRMACGTYTDKWMVLLKDGNPRAFPAGAVIRIPLPGAKAGPAFCIQIQGDPRETPWLPLQIEVRVLR